MNKNVCITIKSTQTVDNSKDTTELFTFGRMESTDGGFKLYYDESEATGYEGSHVQMRIDDKMMTLTRTGTTFSSLIFENKTRHFCHYGTEFGDCMVGITTDELKPELNENGGKVHLKYTIDVNGGLMAENEITINVKM